MSNDRLALIEYENQSSQSRSKTSIILLHGLLGTAKNLSSLARHLSNKHHVLSFDLPNHGRSSHFSNMDIAGMAQQVILEAESRSHHKLYCLGHSLGGKVAMSIALQKPDLVSKLVVADIAPVVYPPHHLDIFKGLLQVPLNVIQSRADAETYLEPYISESATRHFLLQNLYKTEQGYAWRMNLPVLSNDYKKLCKGLNLEDYSEPFTKPTLFIGGGDSDYIKPEYEMHTRSLFPNFEYKQIAGAGHWLHAEKPQVFNRLVSEFLDAD